jgi:hypothetical protein
MNQKMKKIITSILSLILYNLCYSQTTNYGYAPRNTQSAQVNYAKVGEDANKMLQNYLVERERKLKELGWASAAEYDAYQKMLKKQKRLKRKDDKGDENIGLMQDQRGNWIYYKKQ